MSDARRPIKGAPIDDAIRTQLIVAMLAEGVPAVAKRIGIGRAALTSAASGMPVLRQTGIAIRVGLGGVRHR